MSMEHTKNGKDVVMNKKEDKKLNDCYQELFEKVVELQSKYPTQMVAGNMMAQALRIYRSTLNDEGFMSMIETIAENKDQIEPYDNPTIN